VAFFIGFRVDGVGVRFLLIYWIWSLVSNFKIETKNDASVNCDLVVTYVGFRKFEKFGVGV